jgi:hypothetical protein
MLRDFYHEISESYRAIDDFRTKLLALLPLATGTGVFLLLKNDVTQTPQTGSMKEFLFAAGAFGMLFTLGLFAYELYGVKKCHGYIYVGGKVEQRLGTPGQFVARPQNLGGFINEPFAACLIYPASLAAWAFAAFALIPGPSAVIAAAGVFFAGLAVSVWIMFGTHRVEGEWARTKEWDRELEHLLQTRLNLP